MWRGHGLLPIVVEEEKHGSERMHACVPFLGSSRERLPLAGSPVTLSPNRTYEFPGIRLSLYVSLKMFSIRERTSVELLVTGLTEDECFPVSSRHQLLPSLLSVSYILEFANVMDFKCPFACSAIFASLSIQASDEF